MAPEIATCPVCKQKLMVQDYVVVGSEMVCADCETTLRITSRKPLKIELVPYTATLDMNGRPESYS
jgi:hypothetical protein